MYLSRNKTGVHSVIQVSNRKGVLVADTLGGAHLRGRNRPSRSYAAGRVCMKRGCSTKISIYNRREYCNAHAPVNFPRVRGHVLTKV